MEETRFCHPLASSILQTIVAHGSDVVWQEGRLRDGISMRVDSLGEGLRFVCKVCCFVLVEGRVEELESRSCLVVHVGTEVDVGRGPPSQQSEEMIVPDVLAHPIWHRDAPDQATLRDTSTERLREPILLQSGWEVKRAGQGQGTQQRAIGGRAYGQAGDTTR
jgi:hypothetical protein